MYTTVAGFIRQGYGEISRRKKIVWTWYGLQLLCSIVILAPLMAIFAVNLGSSLESRRLFENFDTSWLVEILWSGQYQQMIAWAPVMAIAALAFVFISTWLTGGLLTVLNDVEESFFAGCARWFPPFVRLFLWSLIGYAIVFAVRGTLGTIIDKVTSDSMSAQPAAYGSMVRSVISWALLLFVTMVMDYAKIHMVTHGVRASRRGLWAGLRFVLGNFRRTSAIFALLTLIGLLMLGVYHVWSEVIGQASMAAVLLLFILRQIYVVGRTWLRMVFLASERLFFVNRMPTIVAETLRPPAYEQSYDSSSL